MKRTVKRLREEAKRLRERAKAFEAEADEIWASNLLVIVRRDLEKTWVTQPDKLHNLGNLLSSLKFYIRDLKTLDEIEKLLNLPGVRSFPKRKWGNPEIKKIMQDRGVTRQRAHQIIKERKLKTEQSQKRQHHS